MSFILDALRKSDARRQQAGAPGLNSPEPPRPARPRRRRWPFVATALVLAVVVAAGMYFALPQVWAPHDGDRRQAQMPDAIDEARESASADASANPSDAQSGATASVDEKSLAQTQQSPGGMEAEAGPTSQPVDERVQAERSRERRRRRTPPDEATGTQGVQGEPRQRESAPIPSDEAAEELRRRVAEAERRRREAQSEQSAEPSSREPRGGERSEPEAATEAETRSRVEAAGSRSTPKPLNEGVAEYVRAWELPLSVRRSLPELKLTIHVYSPSEPERFVLINGERHVAGDVIDGARIVEINRDGAVVDFRSHRFLLEPR